MHVYLGFTRSNNMINLNTESLLQIFYGIKNNTIANHMKKRRIDQNHNTRYSQGKLAAQNPSIIYYIFHKESWNNYILLLSQESFYIQLIVSHWLRQNQPNTQPILSLSSTCLSHILREECNPYSQGIPSFLHFAQYHRHPVVF